MIVYVILLQVISFLVCFVNFYCKLLLNWDCFSRVSHVLPCGSILHLLLLGLQGISSTRAVFVIFSWFEFIIFLGYCNFDTISGIGFQLHGRFCLFSTQIPSICKLFFPFTELMGGICLVFHLQRRKSFLELCSMQNSYFL